MGLDASSVVVIHVGGGHADVPAALDRFARAANLLPESVRRRLALENGDRQFSLRDVLWAHRRTGIPVVLDTLHHRCHNPDAIPMLDGLKLALATWPAQMRPKIHFSSPRHSRAHPLSQRRGPHADAPASPAQRLPSPV